MLNRPEVHHIADPVHSAAYYVVVVQSAQLLLAVVFVHIHQLAHPQQGYLGIVLAHGPDVVLCQHSLELGLVFFVVFVRCAEQFELVEMVGVEVSGYDFLGEEVGDNVIDGLVFLQLLVFVEGLELLLGGLRPGVQDQESHIVGENIGGVDGETEI